MFLSRAVPRQIMAYVTLKSGLGVVQGHCKWQHSIDRMRSIVCLTIAASCIIYEKKNEILVENRDLSCRSRTLHSLPLLRRSPLEYCHKVWYRKTRMELPDGEKSLRICLCLLKTWTSRSITNSNSQTVTLVVYRRVWHRDVWQTLSNIDSATSSLDSSWNTWPRWKYPPDVRMSSMPYSSDAW